MPYASLACDMTSASEVAVAAWGALQVLYAFAFANAGVEIQEWIMQELQRVESRQKSKLYNTIYTIPVV